MPWWGWALIGIAAWTLSGLGVGLLLAGAIRLADTRREDAPPEEVDKPPLCVRIMRGSVSHASEEPPP